MAEKIAIHYIKKTNTIILSSKSASQPFKPSYEPPRTFLSPMQPPSEAYTEHGLRFKLICTKSMWPINDPQQRLCRSHAQKMTSSAKAYCKQ